MPTKILTTHSQRLSNQLWNIHSKWLSNQSQNIQTNSRTFKLVLEQIQTGYLQKLVLQYNIFKLVLKDQNTFQMVSNQQYPQFYWRWGGGYSVKSLNKISWHCLLITYRWESLYMSSNLSSQSQQELWLRSVVIRPSGADKQRNFTRYFPDYSEI